MLRAVFTMRWSGGDVVSLLLLALLCLLPAQRVRGQQQLIAGGQLVAGTGAFPWHVGIYRVAGTAHVQECGGTLIAARIVVSAAHCFWDDSLGRPKNAARYKVAAGKVTRDWTLVESSGQRVGVAEIALPRRYRGQRGFLQHDVALLALDVDVVQTPAVGFALVDWRGRRDAEHWAAGSTGVVAGWGITEDEACSDRLRFVHLPYVDPDLCFNALTPDLQRYLTEDKFCAGFAGRNVSVCPGDSGGGLVFDTQSPGQGFLRGVVSVGYRPPGNSDACYARNYAGFTRVTPVSLLELAARLSDQHRGALLRLAHAAPADFSHAPGVGFLKLHHDLRDFGDAWMECERQGARLAVLGSESAFRALAALLDLHPEFVRVSYAAYIGAHSLFSPRVFASIDGSPLGNGSHVRWKEGEPNDTNGTERCVVMYAQTALLNDGRCGRLLGFICEIPLRWT